MFNLDFLSFRFDSLSYTVLEGDTLRCRRNLPYSVQPRSRRIYNLLDMI